MELEVPHARAAAHDYYLLCRNAAAYRDGVYEAFLEYTLSNMSWLVGDYGDSRACIVCHTAAVAGEEHLYSVSCINEITT